MWVGLFLLDWASVWGEENLWTGCAAPHEKKFA
jgi:hypothetical protein